MDRFEVKRQIFHLFFGIFLVLSINYGFINLAILLMLIIMGFVISNVCKKTKLPAFSWLLRNFEREKDLKTFPGKGMIFYLIGALAVLTIFDKDIALASIMVLAFGDSFSRLVGEGIGKIKNPLNDKKFIEGAIFGIIMGFIGAIFFVKWQEALIASAFAMIAEGIEIKFKAEKVDDNIIVPIVAGVAIWLFRAAYGMW